MKLRLATAQFPVSGSVTSNLGHISEQIMQAGESNAELIHFSECCLTGYPDIDIEKCLDSPDIITALDEIGQLAQQYSIWVVLGSHYFEAGNKLPYNSIFVFNNTGKIVGRYDKRILAGAPGTSDQRYFRAGHKPLIFEVNGVKTGIIICHEWRYPELFREYKQLSVDLILHSFYDGNLSSEAYRNEGIALGQLISGSERSNAANNYLWVSVANTCKKEQVYASAIINPDGSLAQEARRNSTQLIFSEINLAKKFIDPSKYGRERITELFPEKFKN